jgi:hypothetical protein
MADREFKEAAAAAKVDAFAARQELGMSYAAEFKSDPAKFDPHKLVKLGREGLPSFLANVNVPARQLDSPREQPVAEIVETSGSDRDWKEKHTVPLPFELSAFLFGVFAGIGVIFGLTLVLTY